MQLDALLFEKLQLIAEEKHPELMEKTYSKEKDKFLAVKAVKNLKNYKVNPVRRVYTPRLDDKKRPIGIPTIKDKSCANTISFRVGFYCGRTS